MKLEFENLVEDGKNKNPIYCSRCPSKILNPKAATYKSIQYDLPCLKKKTECDISQTEELSDYWEVPDMYTFENMGFLNTKDNRKYLICADCEMGPLGWHDLKTQINYIALSRVKHKEDDTK